MELMWLGYDGVSVPYSDIVAVLFYRPSLDIRIIHSYGRVPIAIRAVVVTADGVCWPSRWQVEHLRKRWQHWCDATQSGRRDSCLEDSP